MAVPTRIYDLSATAGNNSPTGGESIGSNLDNYLRGIQAVLRGDLAHKGADIASATTTDLGAVVGLMHDITGTTTITSFGTVAAGVWKIIKFEGALTLTNNATSLILTSGATRTTANGDIGIYISEGSGNWREVSYFPAGGGMVPVGAVFPYAGSSAPSGYLLCFGQAVSRSDYANLFTAISTTYGAGDGSTTFNVPDLRGRVVAGQDDMGGSSANRLTDQSGGVDGDTLGDVGGSETHTLTTTEMPTHTHTYLKPVTVGGSGNLVADGVGSVTDSTGSAGSGGAHNNVQPTIILNYIIKT